MKIFISILIILNTVAAYAKILDPGDLPTSQVSLGLHHSWVETPDHDTQRRLGFEVAYFYKPFSAYDIAIGGLFIYLPDTTKWTDKYEIYFDQYNFIMPISYSYSYVFRYRLALAPGLSLERSNYNFLSKTFLHPYS